MNKTTSSHDYLIIAGTTRAATTSMFNYLADHPDVCASLWKETRFFLDLDYPLDIPYSLERDGLKKYETFFTPCSEKRVRLEATPDYMYSPNTPHRIRLALPEVRLIFLLREPISRLISWYRFARQRNLIPADLSFDHYVHIQLEGTAPDTQAFRALAQGRYARYLEPYFNTFERERILVTFLEELEQNPVAVMQQICSFVNISPAFYTNYRFEITNRSEEVKNPKVYGAYVRMRRLLRRYTAGRPLHRHLKRLREITDRWFAQANQAKEKSFPGSSETHTLLEQYYREENRSLASLLGRSLPWEET